MKTSIRCSTLGLLGTAAWLLLGLPNISAQDSSPQGSFDPAQMRQRMLERMKQRFEVQDDAEWKLISDRIGKVMEARRALGGPGGPGGMGGPGGPPPPGNGPGPDGSGAPQGPPDQADGPRGGSGGPGGRGGFARQSSPELDLLNKAIEGKASAAELKSRLETVRAARKKKEAALQQAQDELRQLLSVRQEAIAVSLGLLN